MPRTARASAGDVIYHVINRGNRRATVFHEPADYVAFVRLVARANERLPMRVLGYCLMPNHFHLVLWPHRDGDLSRWMQWLLTAHVRRYHRVRGTTGRIWQGRFKAFAIQSDGHLLAVLRYVERNPLRAGLVKQAEAWRWSSVAALGGGVGTVLLDDWPVPRPGDWLRRVNGEPEGPEALARLRVSVIRGAPYGEEGWARRTAAILGVESSLRPCGRPSAGTPMFTSPGRPNLPVPIGSRAPGGSD